MYTEKDTATAQIFGTKSPLLKGNRKERRGQAARNRRITRAIHKKALSQTIKHLASQGEEPSFYVNKYPSTHPPFAFRKLTEAEWRAELEEMPQALLADSLTWDHPDDDEVTRGEAIDALVSP